MINDLYLETILSKFAVTLSNYEIINIKDYQGWSSQYLYLVVASEGEFLLKGKSQDQLGGVAQEYALEHYFASKNVLTRFPIKTLQNETYVEDEGVFWLLCTYIHGSSAHTEEYTVQSIVSFAKLLNSYYQITAGQDQLVQDLKIQKANLDEDTNLLSAINAKYSGLQNIIPGEANLLNNWCSLNLQKIPEILNSNSYKAVIHNDINIRNILMDHSSKNIIALIDWDHCVYGSPLKDVCDAINVFYDYLERQKAESFENVFVENLDVIKETQITASDFKLLKNYYATIAKWKSIIFYYDLLQRLGNKTGEEQRFISEIKAFAQRWERIVV